MTKNDGGPAFPGEYFDREFFDQARKEIGIIPARERATTKTGGMSLRDYFAAQALPFCIPRMPIDTPDWQEDAAWKAYSVADAMLAERAKERG